MAAAVVVIKRRHFLKNNSTATLELVAFQEDGPERMKSQFSASPLHITFVCAFKGDDHPIFPYKECIFFNSQSTKGVVH